MKPITLTMTAFGPYKDKEVIDFSKLEGHRLFVVSGKTGAGKTTLFDGICFALFGSASGEDRGEPRMMRSQFAPDDMHTGVEFIFELHGRRYRVLRQMSHVKQGNKSATGEKYEFYEQREDSEVPVVDRQIVSEINEKVKQLIGLTEDQFKQIVMLPQGEFRKLLTSETDNKEAILRKIFKTQPYQWFSQRMKEKRDEAAGEHKLLEGHLDQQISHVREAVPDREASALTYVFQQEAYRPVQVADALEQEGQYYEQAAEERRGALNQAKETYEKKYEAYHEAKQLQQQFDQLRQKEAEARRLEEQKPAMDEKQKQLTDAGQAASIEVFDQYRRDAVQVEQEKTAAAAEAEKRKEQAAIRRERAEKVHAAEQGKQPKRDQTTEALRRLEELLPIAAQAEKGRKELAAKKKEISQQEKRLQQAKEEAAKLQESTNGLRQEIRGLEQETETLPAEREALREMSETGKTFRQYMERAKGDDTLRTELKMKEEKGQQEKASFEAMEQAWIQGRAAVLAGHLHDGEACPVCGSTEHPDKAENAANVPEEEALEEARTRWQQAQQEAVRAEAELQAKAEETARLRGELTDYSFTTLEEAGSLFQTLLAEAKEKQETVRRLEKAAEDLKAKRKQLEQQEEAVTGVQEKQEETSATLQQLQLDYAAAESTFNEQQRRLPEDLQTEEALQSAVEGKKQQKQELDEAWEAAQKEYSSTAQEEAGQESAQQAAAAQLAESREKRKQAEERFAEAVTRAGFSSEAAYQAAVLPEEARHRLKEELDTYASTRAAVQQQVTDLQQALAGKQPVDLEAMSGELTKLEQQVEEARQRLTEAETLGKTIRDARGRMTQMIGELEEKEKRVGVLADLHDMVRGQNSSKISFERYVQIEFLEQIIAAANERLHRITNGQFHLVRSDRQESRGKQSGLSLDVYDAYTGQNRDVKTLSGGEKFNASLSMALGMSDVIQSYQGGITIDTMFIDEGFGSLDEESLHKVIDTLIDLQQSGRLIGVISHVQEMKNVFPATLEVNKTPEGHSETRFVIK
ncbi:SbcC/MukB-like Walker B domain-containing protein [Alkalicoccus chagannorensis]|uniref:SbcC/MukB-like Walker B domain-containing protein n=1 Tax=Alkalicoccus chagannorensis TaxID=427072 RepID=UPI00040780AE|nr:SMC family ATPase [Alkalicoccus chagannorensis]